MVRGMEAQLSPGRAGHYDNFLVQLRVFDGNSCVCMCYGAIIPQYFSYADERRVNPHFNLEIVIARRRAGSPGAVPFRKFSRWGRPDPREHAPQLAE